MCAENEWSRKIRRYKKERDLYMPRTISSIASEIPEKVQDYYLEYPFEVYGEPIIQQKLKQAGIQQSHLAYQECYDAASEAYLYSIHRCAFCNYSHGHVENYIKKMISISIVWGIVIANEDYYLCKAMDMKRVFLDADENDFRW